MLIAWPMFFPQWVAILTNHIQQEKSGDHEIHLLQIDQWQL